MKEPFVNRLDLFVSNTQLVKKAFAWKSGQINRLAALLYTAESKTIDTDAIRDSNELIKNSTGLFSTFRGTCLSASQRCYLYPATKRPCLLIRSPSTTCSKSVSSGPQIILSSRHIRLPLTHRLISISVSQTEPAISMTA